MQSEFTFEISLSVLDHLGRNLYRSFTTVLGEAISNAWDADAENVYIDIDRDNNNFIIKDDGIGMTDKDFQDKFLKIGYTKRQEKQSKSPKGRPYIGRKGIGKLALLSCAKLVSIISKTSHSDYINGVIDNSKLDDAIKENLSPQEYPLGIINQSVFDRHTDNHNKGTIIYFEDIHSGIRNKLEHLKKIIALYFKFSLIDRSFNIFLNEEKITENDLKFLAVKTQFLWNINNFNDPYLKILNLKERISLSIEPIAVKGFVAATNKPSNLDIRGIGEKISIDIFVNGRLRERNVFRHMPTLASGIVSQYLYGQIHFDELDDTEDRFTSSREAIKEDDEKYKKLLEILEHDVLRKIRLKWDELRIKHKEDGDPENEAQITIKQRKAKELVNTTFKEYDPPQDSRNKDKINQWNDSLREDAEFNLSSYIDCFLSENLMRLYIKEKNITLTQKRRGQIKTFKESEENSKNKGNISINIREKANELSYLSMDGLADLFDKKESKFASLSRDAQEYKPIRDALAHTARLTEEAKSKLNTVYNNIKARLKELLNNKHC